MTFLYSYRPLRVYLQATPVNVKSPLTTDRHLMQEHAVVMQIIPLCVISIDSV